MRKIKDTILKLFVTLKHNERGATAVEYGIMVALIAAVIITVVALLGTEIQAAFQSVVDGLA